MVSPVINAAVLGFNATMSGLYTGMEYTVFPVGRGIKKGAVRVMTPVGRAIDAAVNSIQSMW